MINNLKEFPRPYNGAMLCIDPGMNIGLAWFRFNKTAPFQYQSLYSDHKSLQSTEWEKNADNVIRKLKVYLHTSTIPQLSPVFIEEPQFFNTHTGYKSAASQSLAKLVFITGRIWQIVTDHGYRPIAVPINAYKGQMHLPQVQSRIKRASGGEIPDEHAAHAVLIGLWMRGLYK